MIIILGIWLACLAVVFLMVKRAPLIDEDPSEEDHPDDPPHSSEFRPRALF